MKVTVVLKECQTVVIKLENPVEISTRPELIIHSVTRATFLNIWLYRYESSALSFYKIPVKPNRIFSALDWEKQQYLNVTQVVEYIKIFAYCFEEIEITFEMRQHEVRG